MMFDSDGGLTNECRQFMHKIASRSGQYPHAVAIRNVAIRLAAINAYRY